MRSRRFCRTATGLLLILAVLCFVSSKAVEVEHPIEEWRQKNHEHSANAGSAQIVCLTPAHQDHHCLHQQSLVPKLDPPHLLPQLQPRPLDPVRLASPALLGAAPPHSRSPPVHQAA